jgi:hypothetical protein
MRVWVLNTRLPIWSMGQLPADTHALSLRASN